MWPDGSRIICMIYDVSPGLDLCCIQTLHNLLHGQVRNEMICMICMIYLFQEFPRRLQYPPIAVPVGVDFDLFGSNEAINIYTSLFFPPTFSGS